MTSTNLSHIQSAVAGGRRYGTSLVAALALCCFGSIASASTVASWTFETSIPLTAGPFAPEVGAGSATGLHAGAAVYSSPSGNGSAHSFSSNLWAVGDYYQFQVDTTALAGVVLDWDQTSSATGPGHFQLSWSIDGSSFTNIGSPYTVLANATVPGFWNTTTNIPGYHFSVDLSSITSLDNDSSIFLRMATSDALTPSGGAVGTGGTDRVDNVTITATAVPEPSTCLLGALGAAGVILLRSRKRNAG